MYGERTRRLAAVSIFALAAAGAGAAQAQQSVALEEIVVTAQKREQPALEVPISLTALSGARLEQLGVHTLADLALYTPGLRVQEQSPNNPGYVIRGITSDNTNAFEEPRVSIFQDGVSISKAQASYVELFDLDRVEVAKGPQSTLFGRAALIGGVNLIQNKASLEGFDGSLHGEGGELGYAMGEGAVNLPVSDSVALRLAGRVRQRDGYVKNALGGADFQSVDTWALRAALKFAPDPRLNADLIVNYQEDHPSGTAFKSKNFSPTDPTTGQVLASRAPWDAAALSAPADFPGGNRLGVDRTVGGATGLVDFKLNDALTLHSISAFRRYTTKEVFDADGTSLPILTGLNDGRGDQWSQEFRVNYDAGSRLRGFVGASLFKTSDDQRVPLEFDERVSLAQLTGQLSASALGLGLPATTPAPMAVFGNTAFTGRLLRALYTGLSGQQPPSNVDFAAIAANLSPNHVEQASLTSDVRAADLFGDATFKVTERFEVSGGLRYSHEKATTGYGASVTQRSVLGGVIGAAQLAAAGATTQAGQILGALQSPNVQQIPASLLPLFGLTDQPTANNGDMTKGSLTDDGLTWRLVGRYTLSPDANVYASYARGRKPPVQSAGGPTIPGGAPNLGEIAAETVDSYDVGAKAALLDHRLRADVAFYDYEYRHFQTVEQRGVVFIATDAGKAKAYGLEAQLTWAAAPGLDLYATYAYSHARLRSGLYAGNHFRLSPDHAFSLAATWSVPAFGGRFQVLPSYSWQSMVFFADNNDRPEFQQPPNALVADNVQDELQKGYGLANLRVSWSPQGGRATFEVFATNLFDKKYLIDAGNTGDNFGLPTFIAGPPRVVGAGVYYRFR
ncbi:MAG: TonB-dependent receptor [Phenylobacterium sp.]|nr:TonB-dependent receptor [Phenylobacterium sp.]